MTVSEFQVFEPVLCLVEFWLFQVVQFPTMVLFLSCPHRLVSMYLLVSCAPSLSVSPALPLSCISHSVLVMSPCFVSLPCSSLCVSSSSPQSVVCSHVCLFPYQCQVRMFVLLSVYFDNPFSLTLHSGLFPYFFMSYLFPLCFPVVSTPLFLPLYICDPSFPLSLI